MSVNAKAIDHVVVRDKNGNPTLRNLYRNSSGKQVVSPVTNWEATARFQLEQEKFKGTSSVRAAVMSGRTGVMSANTVPVTITQGVSKRKVFAEVLEKARAGGKSLGKGAAAIGKKGVGLNPLGIAFSLALGALLDSDFFWSEVEGDFVRKPKTDDYYVFKTKEVNTSPSSMTSQELEEWCRQPLVLSAFYDGQRGGSRECSEIEVVSGISTVDLKKIMLSKCGSNSELNGHYACYDKETKKFRGFAIKAVRIKDYIPITLDEFIDEGTPEAAADPDQWVNVSDVKPDGEPTVSVLDGTVAQSAPYTDPVTGNPQQTRWDFEDGKVKETDIPRPDLDPDSPEAPRPDPDDIPKDDTGSGDDTGDKTGDGTGTGDKTGDGTGDKTGSGDKDKQNPKQSDLCKEHPDILACDKQPKAEKADDIEIPQETKTLTFSPDTIFPANGVCPAPVSFTADFPFIGSKTFAFDTAPACDVASKLRGIIIACAWLVAATLALRAMRST